MEISVRVPIRNGNEQPTQLDEKFTKALILERWESNDARQIIIVV